MLNLIRNEMKKIISKKRFIVVLLMSIGIISLAIYATYGNLKYYIPKDQVVKLKESVNYYKEKKKYALENKQLDKISNYDYWLKTYKDELAIKEYLADEKIPYKEKLKKDIEFLNESKKSSMASSLDTEIEKLNDEISIKQYYLDNDLEYDYNNITAFQALPNFFTYIGRLLIIIIIGILAADSISGEYDPETIKMLLTKPISRGKILVSKFLTLIIMCNGVVLILEIMGFIVLGLMCGFGNPNAPMTIGTRYKMDMALVNNTGQSISSVIGSSYLCTYWQFIIKALILQTLLITATISFCFLVSTLIKNSSVSTGVSFVTMFLLLFITIKVALFVETGLPNILNRVLPFIFTSYFDVTAVIKGSWAESLICPLITYKFSLIVLTVWIVGCYLISHINFVKKDII